MDADGLTAPIESTRSLCCIWLCISFSCGLGSKLSRRSKWNFYGSPTACRNRERMKWITMFLQLPHFHLILFSIAISTALLRFGKLVFPWNYRWVHETVLLFPRACSTDVWWSAYTAVRYLDPWLRIFIQIIFWLFQRQSVLHFSWLTPII